MLTHGPSDARAPPGAHRECGRVGPTELVKTRAKRHEPSAAPDIGDIDSGSGEKRLNQPRTPCRRRPVCWLALSAVELCESLSRLSLHLHLETVSSQGCHAAQRRLRANVYLDTRREISCHTWLNCSDRVILCHAMRCDAVPCALCLMPTIRKWFSCRLTSGINPSTSSTCRGYARWTELVWEHRREDRTRCDTADTSRQSM
ncbi:hypothetical protein EDB81DRAFT_786375, partial [Dactylonectria macrodidyma]